MQQNTKINTLVPLFLVVKLESGNNLAKTWLFRTKFGINLALLAKKFGFEKEKMLQKNLETLFRGGCHGPLGLGSLFCLVLLLF